MRSDFGDISGLAARAIFHLQLLGRVHTERTKANSFARIGSMFDKECFIVHFVTNKLWLCLNNDRNLCRKKFIFDLIKNADASKIQKLFFNFYMRNNYIFFSIHIYMGMKTFLSRHFYGGDMTAFRMDKKKNCRRYLFVYFIFCHIKFQIREKDIASICLLPQTLPYILSL